MAESKKIYRLSALNLNELNLLFSQLGDRLDQIEGYRGSPNIQNQALTIGGLSYTWPSSQGGNTFLKNNGSGVLTWENGFTVVRKTADETVNNSNTLQNDDELIITVPANQILEFESFVIFSGSGASCDIKFKWNVSTGITMWWNSLYGGTGTPTLDGLWGMDVAVATTAANIAQLLAETDTITRGCHAVGERQAIVMKGIIMGGTADGTATLQWAQNTALAADTVVHANSFIKSQKLA